MSIDKEFVPYTESLELKELGFDEPCFGYYDLDGLQISRHRWYPENKNSSFPLPHTTNNPKISAPTFSQAFRFFREKHELESCLKKNYDILNSRIMYLNGKEVCRFIIGDKKWKLMNRDSEAYKMKPSYYEKTYTYEEAELACLKKLIEIVKKQNEVQTDKLHN